MRLLLIRHGIAESEISSARLGRGDSERRLTEAGKAESRKMAAFLKARIDPPALILHSPYARARETAELFASEFPGASLEEESGVTPESEPREWADSLRERAEHQIMIVSHEPFLSGLLSYLLTGGFRLASGFERSAVAAVEWGGPGGSRLEFFVSPALVL